MTSYGHDALTLKVGRTWKRREREREECNTPSQVTSLEVNVLMFYVIPTSAMVRNDTQQLPRLFFFIFIIFIVAVYISLHRQDSGGVDTEGKENAC